MAAVGVLCGQVSHPAAVRLQSKDIQCLKDISLSFGEIGSVNDCFKVCLRINLRSAHCRSRLIFDTECLEDISLSF